MNVTHVIDAEGAFHVRRLSIGQRPGDVIRVGERFASSAEVDLEMRTRERRRAHGADADWRRLPAAEYQLASTFTHPLTVDGLDLLNAAAINAKPARRTRTQPIHVPGLTANRAEVDVTEELGLMLEYANELGPLPGAVYIAWRLTWLHPYSDGSGRTSRAAAYAFLCRDPGVRAAHQDRLMAVGAGTLTVPERLERCRGEYLAAVNAAHKAADRGDRYERFVDLSELFVLLARLTTDQIAGRPSPEDRVCGCR